MIRRQEQRCELYQSGRLCPVGYSCDWSTTVCKAQGRPRDSIKVSKRDSVANSHERNVMLGLTYRQSVKAMSSQMVCEQQLSGLPIPFQSMQASTSVSEVDFSGWRKPTDITKQDSLSLAGKRAMFSSSTYQEYH